MVYACSISAKESLVVSDISELLESFLQDINKVAKQIVVRKNFIEMALILRREFTKSKTKFAKVTHLKCIFKI